MDYGRRLKELRQKAGLSANALAKMVELDPTTIYKIEGGASKPSLDALERICTALDTTLSEFFAEEESSQVDTRAAHLADGATELPPEAEREIAEFMKFMKHKYSIEK